MPKRTWNPKKRKRSRKHGFLKRNASASGRNILKKRRAKKRSSLAVKSKKK